MKRFSPVILFILLTAGAVWYGASHHRYVQNPDPNHTHADFAVWINGKELDFSDAKYMTTEKKESKLPPNDPRRYFHLHDGNMHVIHMHKPGLPIKEFFKSIGFDMASDSFSLDTDVGIFSMHDTPLRMFINGAERPYDPDYVFNDGSHILLTNTHDEAELQLELQQMTDDACLYSQTCPWRGKVPVENCVSDPSVPCTE